MANGERDYEYIQVGGKQGLTPMPTGQVTNTPMPTDIVQGGTLNQLINDSQGAGVVQATGGQVQPTVNEIYPGYATGYDPLATDPTVQAYDPLIEAQRGATSPGALPQTTYTPGINRPITAGGYSGRVIGNTTFFAPQGQVVPLGIIDAREKAMQEAAMKAAELEQQKAAKQAELNAWEVPTSPQLNDKNYQRQYNKEFNTFINESIDEAKKLYGDNWRQAIKDPTNALGRDFQQKMSTFQYIAERGNMLTDKFAKWMDLEQKGELYLPEESKKAVYDAYNRLGDFKNADITDLYGLERQITKDIDINKYFKDTGILSKEMYQVDEEIRRGAGSLSADQWNTFTKETIEPKAREVARMLKETRFSGDAYSEEDIYKNVMSRYADRNKVKAQFQRAGEREKDYYKNKNMNNPILVQGSDFGSEAENVIPLDNKKYKGLSFSWGKTTTLPDGSQIREGNIKGNEEVTFNSIQNHVTPAEGGGYNLSPYVYVTVTSKNESGEVESRQEAIPYEQGEVKAFVNNNYGKVSELQEKVLSDWNTGSFTVAYDKDGVPLNEYQERSTDIIEPKKGSAGKTQSNKGSSEGAFDKF